MSSITTSEKDELLRLVREAGTTLLSYRALRDRNPVELGIVSKADGSSVTAADLASNTILTDGISRIFPSDSIHSEEAEAPRGTLERERVWIIDPLDGTKAFIEGRDDFSVLVGLCVRGEAEAGLMFFPALKRLVTAYRGEGAWEDGRRLQVSAVSDPSAGSLYLRNLNHADSRALPPGMDSGRAFLAVASGEICGAVLRVVTHREWDLAAPAAVLREAGARITDERGDPITFDRPLNRYRFVIASNGACHDSLLEIARRDG